MCIGPFVMSFLLDPKRPPISASAGRVPPWLKRVKCFVNQILQSDLDSALCWLRTPLKHTDECKGLVFGVFAIVGVGLRGCEMYALMLNRVKGTFQM